MRLDDLVFVTSNLDKLREAQEVLSTSLRHRAIDLDEIQSLDLDEVVRRKASAAIQAVTSGLTADFSRSNSAGTPNHACLHSSR